MSFAKPIVWALLSALFAAAPALAQIAPHPDKLTFKPFIYVPPHARDFRVLLPTSQVPAYLAVDHELPLVNIQIYVRTGDYVEPKDHIGLAGLTGYLLTRGGVDGKHPYTAEALDERLAFLAAQLGSSIGETNGQVSLNLLSKDLDEGLVILRDALFAPRFQENKLALRKDQLLNEMKKRNDESGAIEQRERDVLAFGEDHFSNQFDTQASIDGIKRADLIAFHQKNFIPQNFIIAVSGDFDRDTLIRKLDALFSQWPLKGQANTAKVPAPTKKMPPGVFLVNKSDVTQGRVSILLPGMQRDDPDYYAIVVMNHILGGGGFTSRITNRVRSEEGLAYSAGSSFGAGIYYAEPFIAHFQSKLRTCGYAASIVLEEIQKLREGGVTAEELGTAGKQLTETLPRRFATKAQVVATLAAEEFTGRYQKDPDYFQRYRERLLAVKRDDVERVAKKWLDPTVVTMLVVGKKDDLLNPDPRHPVGFASLSKSPLIELPLRDPLTMKPLRPGKAPAAPAPAAKDPRDRH